MSELVRHRDLLFWLTAKEIKVRYKLPVLGFLWALLVPLLLSFTLWLVFTYILSVPMVQVPFFLFLISGVFPWNFFSQSVSQATTSVLDAGPLIKKQAFPRVLIPLSIIAANLFNFLFALAVAIVIIVCSGVSVTRWIWLLPLAIGLELVLTTGIVLCVASLQVRYRDVKYITEIVLMLWFYLTPIFYPLAHVASAPAVLQWVYVLNPFVGIIELYRLVLLGETSGGTFMVFSEACGLSVACSIGIFLIGFATFRRHESTFTDWVMG